jgi:DNA polymerase
VARSADYSDRATVVLGGWQPSWLARGPLVRVVHGRRYCSTYSTLRRSGEPQAPCSRFLVNNGSVHGLLGLRCPLPSAGVSHSEQRWRGPRTTRTTSGSSDRRAVPSLTRGWLKTSLTMARMIMQDSHNETVPSSEPSPADTRPTIVPWPPAWLVEYEREFETQSAATAGATPTPDHARPATPAAERGNSTAGAASSVVPASEETTSMPQLPAIEREITPVVAEATAALLPKVEAGGHIFFDLETRSAVDIDEGGRRYATHPSTQILTLVALWDNRVVVWTPLLDRPLPTENLWPLGYEASGITRLPVEAFAGATFPPLLAEVIAAGRPLCAHNALGFDRFVWQAKGLPEPAAWVDTLPEARAAGLPGKLDEIGKRLIGKGKHEDAAVLQKLCRPDAKGRFHPPTPADAARLARYNLADVLLLVRVFAEVRGCSEPEVVALDRIINERGIAFDRDLARALIRLDERVAAEAAEAAERSTGGAITAKDLRRGKFLLAWLKTQGVRLANLERPTIEDFLNRDGQNQGPDSPIASAVLQARLNVAKISTSKLQQALASVDPDDRLRDQFVYHGAHTGRWSGRGVQIQNLPRPHHEIKNLPALVQAAGDPGRVQELLPIDVGIAAGVSALVRPCFRAAPGQILCIGDFAGIEARGVGWCAGEQALLNSFAAGADVYCDLASRLFGYAVTRSNKRERDIGKIAVLGCGYGMSAPAFARHAEKHRVDLHATGITPEEVVEAYRDAYPSIAGDRKEQNGKVWRTGGLWQDVEILAQGAIELNQVYSVAHCEFRRDGQAFVIQLPSGRRLHYRNARLKELVPPYYARLGLPSKPKLTIVFDSPKRRGETTYGGKLVENIVQAICRDLLVAAMLACEQEGLPVVAHVHDEIVIEVPASEAESAVRRLAEIMSRPPAWAAGFPIKVEAFAAERYFKSPPPGAPIASAQDGKLLA